MNTGCLPEKRHFPDKRSRVSRRPTAACEPLRAAAPKKPQKRPRCHARLKACGGLPRTPCDDHDMAPLRAESCRPRVSRLGRLATAAELTRRSRRKPGRLVPYPYRHCVPSGTPLQRRSHGLSMMNCRRCGSVACLRYTASTHRAGASVSGFSAATEGAQAGAVGDMKLVAWLASCANQPE